MTSRLTAVLAVAAFAGVISIARPPLGGVSLSRPAHLLVIGHRGDPSQAPENTLASVNAALASGVDLIELDVRLSRDGVPVIFHDETLYRTTNGRGALSDLSLRELKALDAGSWKDRRFRGEKIPTLEEALHAAKGRGRLLLDVPVDGMGAHIRAALRRVGIPVRDAVLGTWSPDQRAEFRRVMPEATLFLSEGAPAVWDRAFFDRQRRLGVDAFEIANSSPAFIKAAHTARFPVYAYTINDEPTMRALIAAGVDGIETDYPRMAIRVARELKVRR